MTRVGYGDLLKIPNARWGKGGGVTWLLLATFGGGDQSAPLSSPLGAPAVEVGELSFSQTAGSYSISSNTMSYTISSSAWGGLDAMFTDIVTQTAGRTFFAQVRLTSDGFAQFGFHNTIGTTSTGTYAAIYPNSSGVLQVRVSSNSLIVGSWALNTDYNMAVIRQSNGEMYLIKGGSYTTWRLLWVNSQGAISANAYAGHRAFSTAGAIASMGVRDLPAPFDTDFGIASVNTTTFTQSLGPELITNGDFSAWTGDNPDGWTVGGEAGSDPMVTEVAGGARFYSSATNFQPRLRQTIATAGSYYELAMIIGGVVSGGIRFVDSSLSVAGPVYTTSGTMRSLLRFSTTDMMILSQVAPTDITVNSVSAKQVTLNAIHTATADAIHDFNFTVPSPSLIGQRVEMRYRVNADTPDLDYWVLYLECTAANVWNIRLDSVAAGVATNRVSVTGYGPGAGATVTLRAICEGSLHDVYTFQGTTWTKRGNQINVSHQNTSTGLQAVYSSTVTPNSLRSYPRTDPAYDEELNKE